jgi:hypothetical protein
VDEQLRDAIEELERATEALLAAAGSELSGLDAVLSRRAEAVRRIANLVEQGAAARNEDRARMTAAAMRGDEAARRLRQLRQRALSDSQRAARLVRGLEAAGAGQPVRRRIDCTA